MRKNLSSIILILLFSIVCVALYFYLPSSIKTLDTKISQSSPVVLSEERLNLIKDYGDLLAKGLPESNPQLYFYWWSSQKKISDLRIKRAIGEIKNTTVKNKEIKVWSFLNMGAVIKTDKHTLAFDTANLPFSLAHDELINLVDIFLVSHGDGDHFDPILLKKVLKQNKKVVTLKGFFSSILNSPNAVSLTSGETVDISGVKITAFQTDHRGDGNFNEPNAWFLVEVDGFKILHTGDGRDFKDKSEQEKVYAMKDIDILLGNILLHPYNIRDLKPKVFIPLHLYKFMSGGDLYRESRIEKVLETHNQYAKDLKTSKIIYLLPGESILL